MSPYHKIWKSHDELADFVEGRCLVKELGSVSVEDDLLQMLEVAVVDQTPQVGAIGRGNWNEIEVIHY